MNFLVFLCKAKLSASALAPMSAPAATVEGEELLRLLSPLQLVCYFSLTFEGGLGTRAVEAVAQP